MDSCARDIQWGDFIWLYWEMTFLWSLSGEMLIKLKQAIRLRSLNMIKIFHSLLEYIVL